MPFLSYRQRIISYLNHLKIDGEQFCKKMKENKCLMFGIFPLQCFFNEDGSRDIHILLTNHHYGYLYVSKHQSNLQIRYIEDSDDDTDKNDDKIDNRHEFEKWLCPSYNKTIHHTIPNMNIKHPHYMYSNKYELLPNVNIIVTAVNTNDLETFLSQYVYYSFHLISFDGVELKYADEVLQKTSQVINSGNPGLLKEEISQYRKKGYVVFGYDKVKQTQACNIHQIFDTVHDSLSHLNVKLQNTDISCPMKDQHIVPYHKLNNWVK